MSERAERVDEVLRERELDALIVGDLVNIRWLTGFTGSNGAAVVGPGVRRFITDFRYLTQADVEVAAEWEHEIATAVLDRAAERLPDGIRVGFEDEHLSVKQHARLVEVIGERVELVAAGPVIEELRLRKDPSEVEKVRAAARLADEALTEVLEQGIVGKTERDLALDIEFAMRRRGASGPSFPPIVAAGAHGALVHAQPRDVEIPAGTLIVIDWGAMLDGYASDCTRTFATGELDPRDRALYDLVQRAQQEALDAVRPRRALRPRARARGGARGPRGAAAVQAGGDPARGRPDCHGRAGGLRARAGRRADRGPRRDHRGRPRGPELAAEGPAGRRVARRIRARSRPGRGPGAPRRRPPARSGRARRAAAARRGLG
jgi:Xaa-Pro aminopeptidase